jgi:hypothetical protein
MNPVRLRRFAVGFLLPALVAGGFLLRENRVRQTQVSTSDTNAICGGSTSPEELEWNRQYEAHPAWGDGFRATGTYPPEMPTPPTHVGAPEWGCAMFQTMEEKLALNPPDPNATISPSPLEFHIGTPEECASPSPLQTPEKAAAFDRESARQHAEFEATGSNAPDTSEGGFICDDNRMKRSSGENFPDMVRPICIEGANPAGVTEVPVSGNTELATDCGGRILSPVGLDCSVHYKFGKYDDEPCE